MAELEYEFTSSGLSDLRSDMEALASDTEDVGESAQESAGDLDDMGDTDAGEAVSDGMDDAQESVADVGEEAQDTAQRLQEEFGSASDAVTRQIEGMSEQLTSFNEQEISVGGVDGGDLSAQLDDVGGNLLGSVIEGGLSGGAILGKELLDASRFRSLEQSLDLSETQERMRDLVNEAEDLRETLRNADPEMGDDLNRMQERLDEIRKTLQQMGDEGKGVAASIDNDEFERARRIIGDMADEMQYMGNVTDEAEKELDDAKQEAKGLAGILDKLGEAIGIGSITDKLEDLGGEADDAGGKLLGLRAAASNAGKKLLALAATTTGQVVAGIAAVGTAAAVATKQIADWAAGVAEAGQQLKVLQAQSGVATTEAQELFKVAQQLDSEVDLDTIRDAFKELSLRTTEAREGTGEAREAFQRLGITMDEIEGKGTAEVFRRVREEAASLSEQQRILTLEQIAGGEAGERLARVFGLQADEYERLSSQVSSLSGDQIAALDRMRTQYTQYNQKLKTAKQRLAAAFGPPAVTILNKLAGAITPVTNALTAMATQWRINAAAALEFFGILSEQEALDFAGLGRNPDTSGGSDGSGGSASTGGSQEGESPQQKFGDLLNQQAKEIARIREREKKGLIDQEEMMRQIVSVRESTFKQLQQLAQDFPDLFTDKFLSHVVGELKAAQKKLEQMASDEDDGGDVEIPDRVMDLERAEKVEETPTGPMPTPEIQQPSFGLGSLKSAAEGADSIKDINSLIEATRQQFDTLNNDEAQGFIAKLQKQRQEMKENQAEAAAIGDALARSVARGADRVFQAFGEGISDAIFGGGGMSKAGAKLQLFNAKDQMRSLRESLRQGQISYRKFSLRAQMQQQKIQKKQEQVNDTMKSGFAKAADSMVGAFKKMAKQLIAEITAVIVKMLALKAITTALNISSGGIGGSIISQLGGGAFLQGAADGGTVQQSGLAVIHKGEEIVPSKTVDTLKGLTQPSTPSVQPAMTGGGGMNITVNVTGETRTDGRDLKTSYDKTTATQRRKGRKGRK